MRTRFLIRKFDAKTSFGDMGNTGRTTQYLENQGKISNTQILYDLSHLSYGSFFSLNTLFHIPILLRILHTLHLHHT